MNYGRGRDRRSYSGTMRSPGESPPRTTPPASCRGQTRRVPSYGTGGAAPTGRRPERYRAALSPGYAGYRAAVPYALGPPRRLVTERYPLLASGRLERSEPVVTRVRCSDARLVRVFALTDASLVKALSLLGPQHRRGTDASGAMSGPNGQGIHHQNCGGDDE